MADILKALNEATDSAGAYIVPDEFSRRLLGLVQQKAVTMQDLDVRKMASDVMYIPKVTKGTTAYWPGELGTITASDVAFGRITLTAKKIAALTEASSELLEDNNVAVADLLVEQMAQDIGLELDREIYEGTGGVFTGLIDTGSITNAVDAAGNTNTLIITGGRGTGSGLTGASIAIKAIQQAVTETLKDHHEQPDVSYWNPRTVGSLLQITDGNARPILNQETFGSPIYREGTLYTLYGTRVRSSGQVPINLVYGTTAALSACSDALVGKSKQFGILGQRRGFIWKTDYVIATDKYQWQTTMRAAFSVKYPNSYCTIRAILN
jgi:HK97 family phage major capsid protein